MAQYKGASVDGFRAKTLMKKREKQKEEIEHLKSKITEVCMLFINCNTFSTFEFYVILLNYLFVYNEKQY